MNYTYAVVLLAVAGGHTDPRGPELNESDRLPERSPAPTRAIQMSPMRWRPGIRADVGGDRRHCTGPAGYRGQRGNSSDRGFALVLCG
jgi:hypothetical protein